MNIKSTQLQGVLILAGLLDPCGDIGSQYRYALLPFPWNNDEFIAQVTTIMRCEFQEKAKIEYQATFCRKKKTTIYKIWLEVSG